ncbi:MAG: hypothetical protein IJ468_06090 [Lachnospiraceae bacterium]|nr:hypothetical protein [Lachnospiraceae bacterium]
MLFKRYAHSKKASVIGVFSGVAVIVLAAAAAACLAMGIYTEMWQWVVAALISAVLSIACYVGGGQIADFVAIRALEKKLGKPIIGN